MLSKLLLRINILIGVQCILGFVPPGMEFWIHTLSLTVLQSPLANGFDGTFTRLENH